MHFMIRRYLLTTFIVLISSCGTTTNIDYSYFGYFQNAFFGDNYEIDKEYYEKLEFSYLKIKHKDREAVYVLSDISGDIHTWTGSSYETLKTYKGIIIEMSGIYNFSVFLNDLQNLEINNDNFFLRYSFEYPELVMHRFDFKTIMTSSRDSCVLRKYIRESKVIGFLSKEEVCTNGNLPIYSSQRINNLIDGFEIEFFYKF